MAALITTRGLGRRSNESTLNPSFGLGFGAPVGPIEIEIGDLDLKLLEPGIGGRLFGPSLVTGVTYPAVAALVSAPSCEAAIQSPSVAAMTCAPSVEACLMDPAGNIVLADADLDVGLQDPGVV